MSAARRLLTDHRGGERWSVVSLLSCHELAAALL